jgi:hypothetical protein
VPPNVPVVAARRPRTGRRRLVLALVAAAVVVLVAVLVLAVVNFNTPGPSAGGTPLPGASGHATSQASPTLSDRAVLLSHIPAHLRDSCHNFAVDEPSKAALLAALECEPPGGRPAHAQYMLYETSQGADAAYEVRLRAYQRPKSDCSSFGGENAYQRPDPQHHGTLGCYHTNAGFTILAWTDENLSMLSLVYDQQMTYAQLKAWWQDGGPT